MTTRSLGNSCGTTAWGLNNWHRWRNVSSSTSLGALSKSSSRCLLNSNLSLNLHLLNLFVKISFLFSHCLYINFSLFHLFNQHLFFLLHSLDIELKCGYLLSLDNCLSESRLQGLLYDNLLISLFLELIVLLGHLLSLLLHFYNSILDQFNLLEVFAYVLNNGIPRSLDIPATRVHVI